VLVGRIARPGGEPRCRQRTATGKPVGQNERFLTMDPRQVASQMLGGIDWQDEVRGYCKCPGGGFSNQRQWEKKRWQMAKLKR
jgi:hypothetical protein